MAKYKLAKNPKIQRAIKAMAQNAINYGIKKQKKLTKKNNTSNPQSLKRKIIETTLKIKKRQEKIEKINLELLELCVEIGEPIIKKKMSYYSKHYVLNKYTPIVYKRRGNEGGIGDKDNFYVHIFVLDTQERELQVEFRDYTVPNTPKFGKLTGTDAFLAEWISAVEWDEINLSYTYLPEGIIPNIWSTINPNSDHDSSDWAAPSYRPYLRLVQEYIRSGKLANDIYKNSSYQQLLTQKRQLGAEVTRYKRELSQYTKEASKKK